MPQAVSSPYASPLVQQALRLLGVRLPSQQKGLAPLPTQGPETWLDKAVNAVGQFGSGVMDPTGPITGGQQPGEVPWAQRAGMTLGAIAPLLPLLGKIVYHGSPHVFDKFSLSKVGTGEGAQAYGHGLYFAENPGVAQSYKDALSQGEQLTVRLGDKALTGDAIDDIGLDAVKFLDIGKKRAGQFPHNSAYYAKQAADEAAKGLKGAEARNAAVKARIDEWANAKIGYEKVRGATYHVDLPDESIAKMLDWDAPLSQQPPEVQAAVRRLGVFQQEQFGRPLLDRGRGGTTHVYGDDPTGQQLYEALVARLDEGPEGASSALRAAGIPGIRYFDGSSRGAGQGTRNYVVFDDQLPRIVERR